MDRIVTLESWGAERLIRGEEIAFDRVCEKCLERLTAADINWDAKVFQEAAERYRHEEEASKRERARNAADRAARQRGEADAAAGRPSRKDEEETWDLQSSYWDGYDWWKRQQDPDGHQG